MLKTILVLTMFLGVCGVTSAAPIRASFYAKKFEGRKMANGSPYHARAITAASLMYPLNSVVQVINLENGKQMAIRITDRGPYSDKFSLDLSNAAAKVLGINRRAGWGWVEITRDDIPTEPDSSLDEITLDNQ